MTQAHGSSGPVVRKRSTLRTKLLRIVLRACVVTVLCGSLYGAENATVHGTIQVLHRSATDMDSGDVVVWLTALTPGTPAGPGPAARLMQKGKKFIPHVLAVTQGTEIEFPNQDLFYHNVFSIHQGKTMDLGLYESGAARKIRFSQPGVSYIFCNIHPQMSAVVVVLKTRYYALSDGAGNFQISHVPPGRYKLSVWYELSSESELASQGKEIDVVGGENDLGKFVLHSSDAPQEHSSKDGEAYYSNSPKTR